VNKAAFAQGMAMLSTAFDKDISEPLTELYFEEFGGLDDETFLLLVRVCIRSLTFFPKVAEMHQHLRSIQAARGGPALPEEAFGIFIRKLRGYNPDLAARMGADVEAARCGFTPAELAAAGDCGGLTALAMMPERDLHFERPRWVASFERSAQRAALPAPTPLRQIGGE
jgi:hypothetical protein